MPDALCSRVSFPVNLHRLCALVEHALNTEDPVSEVEEAGIRLVVRSLPDPAGGLSMLESGPRTIHSASFGLFHAQPGSDGAPFVQPGERVEAGQRIGLIEAMKVFSPILADRAGRIVAVLAEHGAEVECGQPLFHVE